MWNDRYGTEGLGLYGRASFDPGTMLMAGTLAATAVGTAVSAGGTIAGGQAANQSAQFTAAQENQNASGAIASSQQQMFDTQNKTRLAQSSAVARAGASGVNAGVGSPAAVTGSIAKRGSYLAAMDLFRGQNTATGLENQAAGTLYSGAAAESGANTAALGTIAGGVGTMASQYGRYAYPQAFGGGMR
jgi:hypothetical protein